MKLCCGLIRIYGSITSRVLDQLCEVMRSSATRPHYLGSFRQALRPRSQDFRKLLVAITGHDPGVMMSSGTHFHILFSNVTHAGSSKRSTSYNHVEA